MRRRSGQHELGRGGGGHAKDRGRRLRISLPSASQTRERRPSYGTKIPESRSITPLSGSAGEPQRYCDSLKEKGLTESFRKKTGLVIDAYFSATKLKWILDNVPGVQGREQKGESFLFGTVETWLIWKLTRGQIHVTDYSNASRTMLFNINTLALG